MHFEQMPPNARQCSERHKQSEGESKKKEEEEEGEEEEANGDLVPCGFYSYLFRCSVSFAVASLLCESNGV